MFCNNRNAVCFDCLLKECKEDVTSALSSQHAAVFQIADTRPIITHSPSRPIRRRRGRNSRSPIGLFKNRRKHRTIHLNALARVTRSLD